jgi:hypothetical protein
MEWILDHMGHTLNVHRNHYRAMSDVIERVDIAKILLIQDNGLVGRFHKKRIQDIQLEGKLHNLNTERYIVYYPSS